jgi:hypothetical protein
MDLIDIDGANANQFRFIISDRERRSLWFSHIITALEELVADIKCAHSRNVNVERRSNVKQIREITAYLLRNNKKGDLMKEIDTYLYWFRFKNTKNCDEIYYIDKDRYCEAILTKLNEIEEKGVDDNTKEFFNMFEMSGDLVYSFRLKEDISNMLSRDAGVHSFSGVGDMKISVDTMYTPREFFSKLPKDFPHWFIDGKYKVAMSTGFREE